MADALGLGIDYGAIERKVLTDLLAEDEAATVANTYGLPRPRFKRGDRVQWRHAGRLHVATVSRFDPGMVILDSVDGGVRRGTVHLRLDQPLATPGSRRWAFDADPADVEPLNAITMLADLEK